MVRTCGFTRNQESFLESFSAELTEAAYGVALHQGTRATWIDLELTLWRELTQTVHKWSNVLRYARKPFAFHVLQEEFLCELTNVAYQAALQLEMNGSFLSAELGMYEAFRSLIEDFELKPRLPANGSLPMDKWEALGG
jgi:hypothetical protein